MSWRNIIIANKSTLSLNLNRLVIAQDDKQYSVPLDDISSIVIDSSQVTLTMPLLVELSKLGIAVISCDQKHMPCGVYLPYNGHYRTAGTIALQQETKKSFLNCCWSSIVKAKIRNQALCLDIIRVEGSEYLNRLAEHVRSNDENNREAVATAYYFDHLFPGWSRKDDSVYNALLNYGYSIIRSAIARELCGHGFQTAHGIHHRSESNAFNLADDIIEPFRPCVDLWVHQNALGCKEFSREHRKGLLDLMNYIVKINSVDETISHAISITCESLVRAYTNQDADLLLLPRLLPLIKAKYE